MNKLYRFAKYTIILSIIPSVIYSFFPGKIVASTIICSYPLLILLPSIYKNIDKSDLDPLTKKIFHLFFVSNCIMMAHGFINLNEVQDYMELISNQLIYVFFIPFSLYFGLNNLLISGLINYYLRYTLPITFLILFNQSDSVGIISFPYLIYPIMFFLLIGPYLNPKSFIIMIIFSLMVMYYYIDRRSVFLNFFITLLIVSTYYYKSYKILSLMKYLRVTFLITPIVFLYLGISDDINVFKVVEDYQTVSTLEIGKDGRIATVDSRTSIYQDVLQDIEKKSAYIFGLGFNGKVTTSLGELDGYEDLFNKGRSNSESAMLNYLQWGGLIGVLSYYLLFWIASYFALFKSKNWFCVMTGLWISFKLTFSFIDDVISFNPSTIFLFMTLGICFNSTIRQMNEIDFKNYIKKLMI